MLYLDDVYLKIGHFYNICYNKSYSTKMNEFMF